MKRLVAIVAVAALLSSCVKEVVEPGMRIRGTYAYYDGTGLSDQYVSFENGYYSEVSFTRTLSYMEDSYWGYYKSYESVRKNQYSIQDGNLIVAGQPRGVVELKEDYLYLQGKKYSKVKSFNKELYSSIVLPEGTAKTISYESKEYAVPVTINRPIPAGELSASTSTTWISGVKVQDGILTFKVSETKVDRDGTILLRYTNADNVTLSIAQRPSTFIKLGENKRTVAYSQSSQSISYTIENPLPGSALDVSCTSNWVKNIVVGAESVTFDVDENPGSSSRIATLIGSYSGAADVSFTLTQSGKPVQSLFLNKSTLALLSGKSETLVATVEPSDAPLQWTSDNTLVAAVSQSGLVSAIGNGTATITVSAENGKTSSCTVTVTTAVTSITLNKTSLALTEGNQEQLTATISPSTATDKTVSWSSSDTSVTTVDQNGLVTAVSKGITTITATANDGSGKSASCSVTVYHPINLSVGSSANCYIVSVPGDYCFRTTKGNSSTSVGSVISAEVLWESYGTSTAPSVGSIINNVSYSNNAIYFSTPSTLKNGNAVIAAKDASGNVLWSWHIWVCNGYNPSSSAQTYKNSAGTMMDRNLGATSATPGDVGALGLLYQWGRKDPFLGSSSISSSTKAKSTLSWPSPVSSTSSNGTIAYAVKNPTTFIKGVSSSNYDWVYSSRDNTLWKSAKTIYDPCPPGWRVPDGGGNGVWSKAVGSRSSFTRTYDSTNEGMNFSGKFGSASTIWYPAAGCLGGGGGSLGDVGGGGWWSCTPGDGHAYGLGLNGDGNVYPSGYYYRAHGRSVRCLQE